MRRLVIASLTAATLGVAGTTMAVAATVDTGPVVSHGAAVSATTRLVTRVSAPLVAAVVNHQAPAAAQSCPPPPPNGGGSQPCGVDHHGGGNGGGNGGCPSAPPFGATAPPCGKDHNSPPVPPPPPGTAACGPADQGGSPATGPISGPLYQVGAGLGGPVGDTVEGAACAVFTNLKL